MKNILFLFFIFCLINTKAQNNFHWADSGAVWHLAYNAFVGQGYQKMIYEKDTIINNQACQKIYREAQILINAGGSTFTLSPIYHEDSYFLYKSNDTIFSFFEGSFRMAFKINATLGEVWDLGNCTGIGSNIKAFVKVDSVYFQTYNGQSLRNIKIHHCDVNGDSLDFNSVDTIAYAGLLGYTTAGVINEKFGPLHGFNGINHTSLSYLSDEYTASSVTCYQSINFPSIQFNNNDCFNNIFLGIETKGQSEFSLFPNPACHQITIKSTAGETVIISDLMGKIVYQDQLESAIQNINVSQLVKGMYLVYIGNKANKLIKN
jgi:hypothetical protein